MDEDVLIEKMLTEYVGKIWRTLSGGQRQVCHDNMRSALAVARAAILEEAGRSMKTKRRLLALAQDRPFMPRCAALLRASALSPRSRPMTFDPKTARVGDKVTVHGVIDGVATKGVSVAFGSLLGFWVDADCIATHEPQSREFKPGDRVYECGFDEGFWVVAVSDGKAWIDTPAGWNKIAKIIHLRHADERE